ncbi:MAG: HD domain-containing protein [Desulfobacteraceae bacterium]|nr:MAG: HD domain-containing protein [Desulfobacteraceae bacterium]
MESIYSNIQNIARRIASGHSLPDFYKDHDTEVKYSKLVFETNPLTVKLYQFVAEHLEDDFGHGLDHALKVTLDAGALLLIESRYAGHNENFYKRRIILLQCAGLLHDMKRKKKNHSEEGAFFARETLKDYPFSPEELDDICTAILNHEAFRATVESKTTEGKLLSDCLYDADKFRWGPDNFTSTLWEMVSYRNPPFSEFIAHYPKGMEGLSKIKLTFRTGTGKKYGPRFIDTGLSIGNDLFEIIKSDYAHLI